MISNLSLVDLVTKARQASKTFNQIISEFETFKSAQVANEIPMHSTVLPIIDSESAVTVLNSNREIGSLLASTMTYEARALISLINTVITANGNLGIKLDTLSSNSIDSQFAIAYGVQGQILSTNVTSNEFKTQDGYSFHRLSAEQFTRYGVRSPEGETLIVATFNDGRYQVTNEAIKEGKFYTLRHRASSLSQLKDGIPRASSQ